MRRNNFKILLIALLTLTSFFSYSQKCNVPTYYLNSEKVEVKNLFLNPKNIDSLKIFKKTENGELVIYTKNHINFLSLDDILKKHTNLNSSSGVVLFRIDGKVIEDLTNIRIDDSYFIYVETKKLTETQYLSDKFRELVIVDIALEKEERKPKIILRGNNETLPVEMNDLIRK